MTEIEQREIASDWFDLLNQRDVDQIVSLYSEDQLSFHPTLWNEHIHARSRARDYFLDFMAKQPRVDSYEGVCYDLSECTFLFAGTMKLELSKDNNHDKSPRLVRFSFIWVLEPDNCWRIIHHHNSVVPTT